MTQCCNPANFMHDIMCELPEGHKGAHRSGVVTWPYGALDAPLAWTTVPPTEPGWYWCQDAEDYGLPSWPVQVVAERGGLYVHASCCDSDKTAAEYGARWWPVRMEPPR